AKPPRVLATKTRKHENQRAQKNQRRKRKNDSRNFVLSCFRGITLPVKTPQFVICAALVLSGFVFRQDRSNDLEITLTEGTNISAVASPDRKSIAMDLQGGLWILPIGGGSAKKITPDTVEARQPSWAPDGQTLAFQGYDDNAWHIYTVRADGSGPAALT